MTYEILVIDDEEFVRDAFTLALTVEPVYHVRTADSGQTGLSMAREQRPDLIFLDLNMPKMSGVEVMRALLGEDPTLRIYIVTAFHREFMEELRDARDSGLAFELARKPLGAEQIRTVVHGALGGVAVDPSTGLE
ncbi:response regulator [Thiococcus pfennigii]|uniref:response regulator n=1 Tax=Thiococcus pfennigii TaxID=1057 RepID=UPI0019032FDF|nr:response regulator [Thiococcus pfennigii]MBK1699805.1 hypothetical protein [Thiococcus pfennigii]